MKHSIVQVLKSDALKDYISQLFGKNTRIGNPKEIEGMAESVKGPSFSNISGIFHYIIEKNNQNIYDANKFSTNIKTIFAKIINWLRNNF